MNIYIILTFFGHYSMLTAVYCVHRTCVNAPCRGTHRIFNSGYNAVKTVVSISVSNSWIYTYSTRWETGYGETVNSYRWTNPCFLWKLSKLRAAATFAITVSWVRNLVTLRLLRRQREYNPQFSGTFKAF